MTPPPTYFQSCVEFPSGNDLKVIRNSKPRGQGENPLDFGANQVEVETGDVPPAENLFLSVRFIKVCVRATHHPVLPYSYIVIFIFNQYG
jgi:hypothetical protein